MARSTPRAPFPAHADPARRGGFNRWRHPKGFGPLLMAPPEVGDHHQATVQVPKDAYCLDFVFRCGLGGVGRASPQGWAVCVSKGTVAGLQPGRLPSPPWASPRRQTLPCPGVPPPSPAHPPTHSDALENGQYDSNRGLDYHLPVEGSGAWGHRQRQRAGAGWAWCGVLAWAHPRPPACPACASPPVPAPCCRSGGGAAAARGACGG